jgi:L-asparaginase II
MSIPLAHVIRNGVVEGVHHGSAVVLDAGGEVLWQAGDIHRQIFPRSANKLMQGIAMLRSGLPLRGELLALACASHSGEQFHLDGALDILNAAGMTADALQCPPDWPLDPAVRDQVIALGGTQSPLYMNCSGKHAAMLFTCELNGWDSAKYLAPDHPLQRMCRSVIEDLTDMPVEHVGVDGCGAPLMSTSLVGLARAYSHIAGPAADDNAALAASAVRSHPEYLSGTNRDDCALMRGVPGLLAKIGAEGVYAIGLGDGRSLALKIDDGADRARIVVAAAIMRDVLGVVARVVEEQTSIPLLGGGRPVGEVVAVLPR